jgi:predicted O-methyltransferase YrrM
MQYSTTQPNWRTANNRDHHPNTPRHAWVHRLLQWGARHSNGLALAMTHGFDSGLVYDYIYRNQRAGRSALGNLVDYAFLNTTINCALRSRKNLLQEQLLMLLIERRKHHRATHLLDIASGTGRAILELLAVLETNDITLTCVDQDEQVLAQGRRLAAEKGLSARVTFIQGDATSLTLDMLGKQPDIVLVAGWYELLPEDAMVCRSLMNIRALLSTHGLLLFTNQVWHPQLDLVPPKSTNKRTKLTFTHIARPVARMERWAREAGFRVVKSSRESLGHYSITQCEV